MSRFTNDIDAIADGLNQGIVQLVSGVITVLLCLGFMLSMNPMVTLVAVFVTPLCFLVGFAITKYGNRRFREQSRIQGQLGGYAEELISGQRTVKAFGYEETGPGEVSVHQRRAVPLRLPGPVRLRAGESLHPVRQ